MCNSRGKGAREKGLRRCLLPHCPRLTASNKNVLPSANVTSYYRASCPTLLRVLFFFVAFHPLPFRLVIVTKRSFIKLLREHIPREFAWKVFRPVIALHRRTRAYTHTHTYTRSYVHTYVHTREGKSSRSSVLKICWNDVKMEVKYAL